MTANDPDLVARLTAVTSAIAQLPNTILPLVDAVHIYHSTVTLGFGYDFLKTWAVPRQIARLAIAINATVSITRSGSRLRLAAEFRHNDINFASRHDLTASDARLLAKALGRKLPAVAAPDPLVFAAAELLKAINTLESA